MRMQIEPIYGWGWFDSDGNGLDVPAPFELEGSVTEEGKPFGAAIGYVEAPKAHPLSGLWIHLSQRHRPADGACNLIAFREKPARISSSQPPPSKPVLSGFANAVQIE